MRHFARRLHGDEGGQAVVLIAITLLGLIMMVGLAIDAGQLYVARRTAQEAADAAAYAGAVVHYQRTLAGDTIDTSAAIAAAYADAALNGFVNGGSVTVVAQVPRSGLYSNNTRYVEVIITEQVRTSIVPGGALTAVAVRAVAGAEPLNNQYAIMALDRAPGGPQPALNVDNGGLVDLRGGGILVNSTRTPAADNNGSNITFGNCATPCFTDVAGSAEGTWPGLRTGQPQEPDPFAGTAPPSNPSCARVGFDTSCLFNALPTGPTVYLDPGVYTIRLQYAGGTTVILRPGVYILKDGMQITGNTAMYTTDKSGTPPPPAASCVMSAVTDCGVFFYNTTANFPSSGGLCSAIHLAGTAEASLSAPNAGDYKNFLVYQDPACTAEMAISGTGTFMANGTIYLPTARFLFDGQNATLTGSQLVAKTINIQTGNISIDFSPLNTAQPILPRLTE